MTADHITREKIETLRKAKRLTPEYTGPVWWECPPDVRLANDGYFSSVKEAKKAAAEVHLEVVWLFAVTSHSISIDATSVIENAMDDLREDAEIPDDAAQDLKDFLEDWCARDEVIESTTTWEEDIARVIVLDAAKFDALIAVTYGDYVRLTEEARQSPTGLLVGEANGLVERSAVEGKFHVRWSSGTMAGIGIDVARTDVERMDTCPAHDTP